MNESLGPKRGKPEQSQERPANTVRGWRAPQGEFDDAMREFMRLTRAGSERKDAFEALSKDWSVQQKQDFALMLAAVEKSANTAPALFKKTHRPEAKKPDTARITDALRAFHHRAVEYGSDMRYAFDDIAKEMQLNDAERAAVAREIMGAMGRSEALDAADEALRAQEGTASDEGAELIPSEVQYERDANAAQTPEELKARMYQEFKRRGARIRILPDGTAELVGAVDIDQSGGSGKRRGRNRRRNR